MPEPGPEARIFRASTNFLVAVGALCAFLLVIAVDAGLRHGDWTTFLSLSCAAGIALAAVLTLRLEVLPSGVKRGSLIGSQLVDFGGLAGARLEVVGARGRGCFTLSLEPRQGRRVRIALRQFPIDASVALLAALEASGIEIAVADHRAEYFARQVALARVKARL